MQLCKPISTPGDYNSPPTIEMSPKTDAEKRKMETVPFSHILGEVLWLANNTRPDIANAVGNLCRFAANPGIEHWNRLKRVLRYLKTTSKLGIVIGGDGISKAIEGWSDADWAGDSINRKSTSGYVFKINNACVSWKSQLQRSTALSSCEAEYHALTTATQEMMWLRRLLSELGWGQEGPSVINEDNQSTLELVRTGKNHGRTKHIDIRHHFLRDQVKDNLLRLVYCPTAGMIADGMTKPLAPAKFNQFVQDLNMK